MLFKITLIFSVIYNSNSISGKTKNVGRYTLELFESEGSFSFAKSDCKNRNAWLVEIKNENINDAVRELAGSSSCWIGLSYENGHLKWNDGEPIQYESWSSSEDRTSQCFSSRNAEWSGSSSCITEKKYVCQSDIDSTVRPALHYGDTKRTYKEAQVECKNIDARAHLAYIKTDKLATTIRNELRSKSGQFYVGGSDEESEGVWKWDDGTVIKDGGKGSWKKYSWYKDEPNGNRNENCVTLDSAGKWIDVPCGDDHYFICQKDIVECPDSFCSNGGSCSVTNSGVECSCPAGKIGRRCENDLCIPDPCRGNGICNDQTSFPFYECNCYPPYEGQFCQELKYNTFGNCQYHIKKNPPINYQNAKTSCKNNGDELAMIKTDILHNWLEREAKNMYTSSGFGQTLSLWIGGNKESDWKWSDGTRIPLSGETGSHWRFGRPGKESCLKMSETDISSSFYWEDESCTSGAGYICERQTPGKGQPCDITTCDNGGTCKNFGCQAQCVCIPGYGGDRCEKDLIKISVDKNKLTLNEGKSEIVTLTIISEINVKIELYKDTKYIHQKLNVGRSFKFSITGESGTTKETLYSFNARPMQGKTFERRVTVTVEVISPARITELSRESILVPQNGDWYIRCGATGVPKPTILWYKDNVEIRRTGYEVRQDVRTSYSDLQVRTNALESHAGIYTCRASNKPPNSKEVIVERSAYLRVKIHESNSSPTDKDVSFSEKMEFSCTFDGFPLPEVRWSFVRGKYETNIQETEGSIYQIAKSVSGLGPVKTVTSKLMVTAAGCMGQVDVKCSANNSFENPTDNVISFAVNKRTKLWKTSAFIFNQIGGIYQKAQSYCKSINAEMPKIQDFPTQNFLEKSSDALLTNTNAYIGLTRKQEQSSVIWRWADNTIGYNETKDERWTSQPGHTDEGLFVGWANGQPSNNDEKNCVVMVHDKSRKWYNVPCSYSTGFFCEKKVLLLPKIELVEIGECSADIKIKWKASSQAIGIKHRIEFVDNKNGNAKKYDLIDIIPNKESLINEITLSFATNYTVKIYVCPDECVSSCNSETQFVTDGGLPNAVRDSKVMQLTSESICIVSWKKTRPEIVLFPYQINITYELNHISSHSPMIRELNKNQLVSSNNVSFTFEPSPNRKYTFSIRAQTCSGFGESAKAVGKCSTGVAAPPNISSPILPTFINEDGTANFSISSINEENGPISCIFIIGVVEPKASRPIEESYNQDRIEKANTNLNMSSSGENAEYIAIVLSRSSVINLTNNDGFISLLLGDNQTTYCNVLGESQHRQKRAIREFSANNPSLDKETNYGFFTVTSTPNDNGDVMYKSSKMSMLQNSKQEPRNSELTWIVAVVIGVIVFICLLLLAVFLVRRRQDKAPPETESMPMERVVQSAEPTYANLTMESKELRSDTDIPLQRLEIVYNSMKLNNNAEFEKEFQKLKTDAKGSTHSTDVGSASSIAAKNRYKNILPYDNTRVKLSGNGDVSYINACYIQGFNEPRKFIATQGPLPNTVDDFWRMIVEQRCNVIVMLTKCFEKGKKKCEKYWPDQGESKQYGKVVVHNIAEAVFGSYINRTLRVKNGQKSEEIVQHYQLLKWPDHGVPMTTSSFFRTYSAVSECMGRSSGPTVVHCSAGAGRTGTFIAYDYLTAERERLNRVDVYNCVINMRQQRVDMVQNCDQYIFIHKLILESYLLGITDSGPDSFHATSGYPKEERDINDEFRRLSTVDPMKNKTYGSSFKSGNRNKNILPYERNRVKINPLNDEIDVPYVNASYIESYDDSYAIIAAQGPVSASVEYFWRSVFDNDVSIIIMLTDCKENNKEQCVQYWPNGVEKTLQLQNVSVVFDEEHFKNGITCRDLRVSLEGEIKQVIQYQYKGWSVSNCPSDPTGVLDLINIMTDRVRSLNNATVIVHCSDGAGRTGTFCAIVNLIERLKCENKIDVFREAKDLRDCRAGMIQTLDQYKFCYLAVSTYLSSFDLYSNFDGKEEETVYENL